MGAFDGMRGAKVFERGNYLAPGVFELEITKCILKKTRKSGDAFIAELKVLNSTSTAHPVGSKATWFQGMRDADIAFGSLKLFVYAVLGLDAVKDKEEIEKEIDPEIEALMEEVCGKDQIFAGRKLCVTTSMKKTKEKQADFTQHDWAPHPETLAARKAA